MNGTIKRFLVCAVAGLGLGVLTASGDFTNSVLPFFCYFGDPPYVVDTPLTNYAGYGWSSDFADSIVQDEVRKTEGQALLIGVDCVVSNE